MTLKVLKQIVFENFRIEDFSHENVSKQGDAQVHIINVKNTNFIIRIGNSIKPYSIQNNYYALEKLKNTNVGPKPVIIGNVESYNYSIETFLPGEIKTKLAFVDIKNLLRKVVKLHSIENEKCGYINSLSYEWKEFIESEIILKHSKKFQELYSNGMKYVDYALKNIPSCSKFNLLHGDLNEMNVLSTKDDCFLFDFESCMYGEKEYDIGYLHFRLNFSNKELDFIVKENNYNKEKILYYTFCILIRKIALSPKGELGKRIEMIEKIYKKLN